MTDEAAYRVERSPFFLDAASRRLFAIHYRPVGRDGEPNRRRATLVLAPFAEEMNRSRRMMTLQAEALAARGRDVLIFDYAGTGDSSGEFSEARWEDWLADCESAIDWLHRQGAVSIDIVAIRLGAMLACQLARRDPSGLGCMALWQPVVSGNGFITQFLRVRVAAGLDVQSGRETTKDLRARIAAGETLEVAGYEVAAPLVTMIDGLRLADLAPSAGTRVYWFELSSDGGELTPASAPVIAAWREAGVEVDADCLVGEPFWTIQEITIAPRLIAATTEALAAPDMADVA